MEVPGSIGTVSVERAGGAILKHTADAGSRALPRGDESGIGAPEIALAPLVWLSPDSAVRAGGVSTAPISPVSAFGETAGVASARSSVVTAIAVGDRFAKEGASFERGITVDAIRRHVRPLDARSAVGSVATARARAGDNDEDGGHAPASIVRGRLSGLVKPRLVAHDDAGHALKIGTPQTIAGNISIAAGARIDVAYRSVIFAGDVVNYGTFANTEGRVVFAGAYTENGAYVSDPADNFFTDLVVGANGRITAGAGDRFFVSEDFLNGSAQNTTWETSQAELIFHGGPSHSVTFAGADLGSDYAGFTNNFAWGTLRLEVGQTLSLGDGNGTPGAAFYATIVDLDGGTAQAATITGNGFNIYYDPANPANAYLGNLAYPFASGGALVPVPEPSSAALLLFGAALLARRLFSFFKSSNQP